jgi:glycosyltransferase involved in cell wall biosynthesis
MARSREKVSVIIPLYNRAGFIEECLRSVLETRYEPLDVLVVDDGSSDAGPEIVRTWIRDRPETIRLVGHPGAAHRGVSATRNLGLRLATGAFITFLDSDDLLYPWRLDGSAGLLETRGDIDAVYDLAERFDSASGEILSACLPEAQDPGDGPVFHLPGIPGTGSLLVRRELFDLTGGFDEGKWVGEDIHMWFRIYAVGRVAPGPERRPAVRFRRHGGNTVGFDSAWIHLREFASVYHWARRRKCERVKIEYLRQRYFGHLYEAIGRDRAAGGCFQREAKMLAHAQFHFPSAWFDSRFVRNVGCLAARWKFRRT